jgi:hypothetical protein
MPLPADILSATADRLENHEESLRIKKVLFCLSKKYWENSLTILSAFSFGDLIQELINNYSTIEGFKAALVKLVKTLNRPNIYTEVAKVIYDRVGRLYKYLEEEPQTAIVVSSASFDALNSVALNLQSHQEQARIKKVIYSVCNRRWENDGRVIDNANYPHLIEELIRHYPTQEALQKALIKLVQNINKQNLYLAISNIIVERLGVLYNNKQGAIATEEEGNTQFVNTQFIQVNNTYNIAPTPIEAQPIERQNLETSVVNVSARASVEQHQPLPPPPLPLSQRDLNMFEMRLQIMQYTNPLRAKVLLFSALYQNWDKNNQDWAMLRSYNLDDLLKEAMQTSKNLTDLETRLYGAAKVFTDFDASMQTINTILEAVKPYLTN